MEQKIKIVLFLIVLIAVLLLLKVFFQQKYSDFSVYYEAAVNTKLYGNPYLSTDPGMSYLYPPITILLLLPFSFFSIVVAEKVWLIISIGLFILSIWLLYRLLTISWRSLEGLSYVIFCLVFFPLKFTLGMGQINIVILLLLILFIYFYEKRKNLAGFFLSLAIMIKISPLLFIFYVIYKKDWEILYSVFVTLLCLLILSLFVFPIPTQQYVVSILPGLSQAWPTAYYNQSITGFLGRLSFPQHTFFELRMVFISGVVITEAYCIKKYASRQNQLVALSSIFPILLVTSSFSWQHHFVLLIPSFILLSHVVLYSRKYVIWKAAISGCIMTSYLLVGYNIKHPEIVPVLLQSHVFYGTMMLWFIHIYLLQKKL